MHSPPALSTDSPENWVQCFESSEHDLESDLILVERWMTEWEEAMDLRLREASVVLRRIIFRLRETQVSTSAPDEIQDKKDAANLKSTVDGLQSWGEKTSHKGSGGLKSSATITNLQSAIDSLQSLGEKSQQGWVGIATPAVVYVNRDKFLVTSRYGDWLKKKRLMGPCILVCLATAVVTTLISKNLSEAKFVYEDEQKLTIYRWGTGPSMLVAMSGFMGWVHIIHCVNQELLFLSLWYFEVLIIVGSQLCASFLRIYNLYTTVHPAGLYDVEWQVFQVFFAIMLELPISFLLATMDAANFKRAGVKSCVIAVAMSYHAWLWFANRYFYTSWSYKPMTIFSKSMGTARTSYCYMEAQMCLFLAKLLFAQMMGDCYSVITAVYRPPHHTAELDIATPANFRKGMTTNLRKVKTLKFRKVADLDKSVESPPASPSP